MARENLFISLLKERAVWLKKNPKDKSNGAQITVDIVSAFRKVLKLILLYPEKTITQKLTPIINFEIKIDQNGFCLNLGKK